MQVWNPTVLHIWGNITKQRRNKYSRLSVSHVFSGSSVEIFPARSQDIIGCYMSLESYWPTWGNIVKAVSQSIQLNLCETCPQSSVLTQHVTADFSSLSSYYWPLPLSGIRRRLFHVSVSNLPAVYLGNLWIVSQQPKFTKCYWPWPEEALEKNKKILAKHTCVNIFGFLFVCWFQIRRRIGYPAENCVKMEITGHLG